MRFVFVVSVLVMLVSCNRHEFKPNEWTGWIEKVTSGRSSLDPATKKAAQDQSAESAAAITKPLNAAAVSTSISYRRDQVGSPAGMPTSADTISASASSQSDKVNSAIQQAVQEILAHQD